MSQVVTKFPTSTTVIVSGWNNPTNAYAEDGANADSSTNGAEQKYGGWNFTSNDIPDGSTITKVEIGCKHYEVDPSGYYQYTDLKYVQSNGSSVTTDLTKRSSLTWDYWDITSYESSWDLTKLINADVRIICKLVSSGGGACYVETENEKTYVIVGDFNNKTIKSIGELQVGEKVLVFHQGKGLIFSPVIKIERSPLVQEDVVEIWSKPIKLKTENIDFDWTSHITVTKKQPLVVFKKGDSKFAGPLQLTAEELYYRLLAGEKFWQGHLWFGWKIKMFPIGHAALRTVNGSAYKIVTEDIGNLITKSLFNHELEFLEKEYGLSLKCQTELGPPFMAIAVKTTSYVDAVALRVTFTPPAAAVPRNIGDSLASAVVNV